MNFICFEKVTLIHQELKCSYHFACDPNYNKWLIILYYSFLDIKIFKFFYFYLFNKLIPLFLEKISQKNCFLGLILEDMTLVYLIYLNYSIL